MDTEKKRIPDHRTFIDKIIAGTVLDMGNAAPPGGLTSIFTVAPPETGVTLNVISTSSPGWRAVTALPPIVVVKMLVVSLVPRTRVTGTLSCAEKTISILVRSTGDAWAGRPMENVIVSIPRRGSEESA
jgi:hypothetical protein